MEKFLNIPVYDLLTSGTTDGTGADLEDTGASFTTDGLSVGDIVHQSSDDEYYTISAITSDTELALTPLQGAPATIASGKAYFIHSATAFKGQIVSCVNVGLMEQSAADTITITYDVASGTNDVVTLTTTPLAAGSEVGRDTLQAETVKALQTKWNEPSYNLVGQALLDAGNIKCIGIAIG